MERLKPGDRFLDRYRIDELLGRGGMGEVWAATDVDLERSVAIKILQRRFADHPEYARSFRRETKTIAKLANPHIVRLYAADRTPDGQLYMVMERIEGITLRTLIKRSRRVEVVSAVYFAIQIADALRLAHGTGIWHRDIKPENVMVTADGHVTVLDFGIAKQTRAEITGELRAAGAANGSLLMGTLRYMAPETIRSGKADQRADFYALGVVLYEMLTGRYPYDGLEEADDATIVEAHFRAAPHPIEELVPEVPSGLAEITYKLLAKEPAGRYEQAAGLLDDLRSIIRDSVPPEHPIAKRAAQDRMEQARAKHFARRRAESLAGVETVVEESASGRGANQTAKLPVGFVPPSPAALREPPEDQTQELHPGYIPPAWTPFPIAPRPPPNTAPLPQSQPQPVSTAPLPSQPSPASVSSLTGQVAPRRSLASVRVAPRWVGASLLGVAAASIAVAITVTLLSLRARTSAARPMASSARPAATVSAAPDREASPEASATADTAASATSLVTSATASSAPTASSEVTEPIASKDTPRPAAPMAAPPPAPANRESAHQSKPTKAPAVAMDPQPVVPAKAAAEPAPTVKSEPVEAPKPPEPPRQSGRLFGTED